MTDDVDYLSGWFQEGHKANLAISRRSWVRLQSAQERTFGA